MKKRLKNPCPECGSYYEDDHAIDCSKMGDEEKAEKLKQYYQAWLELTNERRALILRYGKDITFWQGKFRIVAHENNALRRKLYKKDKIKSPKFDVTK